MAKPSVPSKPPPARGPTPRLTLLRRIVKGVAFAVGGGLTVISLMSVVGAITSNGWARFIVAVIVAVAMTVFAVDRVVPRASKLRGPGFASDFAALMLVLFSFLFVGVAQPVTKPLLVREADRVADAGFPFVARALWYCAGVRPEPR